MEFWINVLLFLVIYSFIGWCCECIYCSIGEGTVVNRGFLYGPFCPIYGFGALGTLYLLQWVPRTVTLIFIAGMVLTSALEYATSWAMEKLFHTSWWDYSDMKFNLHGRICLLNSTLFGLLCVMLVFDIHPKVSSFIAPLNLAFKAGFLSALVLYFLGDMIATLYSVLGINIRIMKLETIKEKLEEQYQELGHLSLHELSERLSALEIQSDLSEKFHELLKQNTFYQCRLLSAFPDMRNRRYPERIRELRQHIEKKRK